MNPTSAPDRGKPAGRLEIRELLITSAAADVAPLVHGMSFNCPPGRITAIVGESGSGKSLTAQAVVGVLPKGLACSGEIMVDNHSVRSLGESELRALRGRRVAMVFQDAAASLNPIMRVGEQVAAPLRRHWGLSRKEAHARARQLLADVGLPDAAAREHFFPHELSGGQQQRVAIAMAVACAPTLLLADEPTSALDPALKRQVLELLVRLQHESGLTLVLITHDIEIAERVSQHVVVVRRGEVLEEGGTAQVFGRPSHAYTHLLREASRRLATHPQRLTVAARPPTPLLEARGVFKTYRGGGLVTGRRETHALEDVSLRLDRGETLAVMGESGSGKTTLGSILGGLVAPSKGEVLVDGQDARSVTGEPGLALRRRIQIVFQNPFASLNPRWTVLRTLAEPLLIHRLGRTPESCADLAKALLAQVGLPSEALGKYPHEFSGGERQRIAIARSLAVRPDVLVCDEAVSSLDAPIQVEVLNLLLELQRELGLAYLFISHDLLVVHYIANRVIVLRQGSVVATGSPASVFAQPASPYLRGLAATIGEPMAIL